MTQALATLRSLASRGDNNAEATIEVFDAVRAEGKEVVIAKAATTANRTLSGLTNTNLDGQTPADGDVVLVKSQTDAKENGPYKTHAGAWERLLNYAGDTVVAPGQVVLVRLGSTLAGTVWVCTSTSTVVGTDNITFSQFTGGVLADGSVTVAKLAAATGAHIFGVPTLAVGVEGSNHIDVTIQLKDILNTNLAAKARATVWVSATAGAVPGTAPNGGSTVQTGTLLKAETTDVLFEIISDASGVIVLRLTDTGTPTFFVNVAVGTHVASSAAVTFA